MECIEGFEGFTPDVLRLPQVGGYAVEKRFEQLGSGAQIFQRPRVHQLHHHTLLHVPAPALGSQPTRRRVGEETGVCSGGLETYPQVASAKSTPGSVLCIARTTSARTCSSGSRTSPGSSI